MSGKPHSRRLRLLVLSVILSACGDDGSQSGAVHAGDRCTRRTCVVQSRSLPAARGRIVDRRGVVLARDGGAGREYPEGALAAHLVGYSITIDKAQLDRLAPQGYEAGNRIGMYGVERAWENYLRGKPGRQLEVLDRRRQVVADPAVIAELIEGEPHTDPVPGDDVVLTIDARLQRLAEDAVAPHGAAAVVVVEVATGRILALVSRPSFDPAVMAGGPTPADVAALDADPRKPFADKTMRTVYSPGSLFSFVTAIAALEDGVAVPGARTSCSGTFDVDNVGFTCTARHGALDLSGALQRECHVHVWKLAEKVGLDRIAEVARLFGFGAPTRLSLNGGVPGRVPTRDWYEQRGGFRIGRTFAAAVGRPDVEVTVLQVAMAYAALAGGTLYVPQVVERIDGTDGKMKVSMAPQVASGWRAPAPEVLAEIRGAMAKAVSERGGTAARARSAVVAIAGQAATAEVRTSLRRPPRDPPPAGWDPSRSHAWFAGWAPADAPAIAIVVLVEHGGSGRDVAAPIARQIIEGWRAL